MQVTMVACLAPCTCRQSRITRNCTHRDSEFQTSYSGSREDHNRIGKLVCFSHLPWSMVNIASLDLPQKSECLLLV